VVVEPNWKSEEEITKLLLLVMSQRKRSCCQCLDAPAIGKLTFSLCVSGVVSKCLVHFEMKE